MQNTLRWFQLLQWTVIFNAWITSPTHKTDECIVPLDKNNEPLGSEREGNNSFQETVVMTSVRAYMKLYEK
eukprot:13710414-Ditylum_brightwellii.AAC.1